MQPLISTDYAFGRFHLKSDERILRVDGLRVALAPKVVDTLLAFAESPDRVLSKAELMDRVWPEGFVEEANLTQNIYVLRKTFARYGGGPRIENVPKRGYRFVIPPATRPTDELATRQAGARFEFQRYAVPLWLAAVVLLGFGGPSRKPIVAEIPVASPYGLPRNALREYLLGRYYLGRGTERDLQRSVVAFDKVIKESPGSPFGYAGMADVSTSLTYWSADPAGRARLGAQAISFANESIARGPNAADAYAALGAVQTSIERDDRAAALSFETALRLDERNLDALVWYGTALMNGGEIARARRLFERAVAVDASAPGTIASLAWADFLGRDFTAAAAFSEQLLRSHRLESLARITLASAYVEMGDSARATPAIAALLRHRDTVAQGAALQSQVYALRGTPHLALETLARFEAHADPERLGSWDVLAIAAAYARAGKDDNAFVWLARIRSGERRQLARDPRFDLLRKDRRFVGWLGG